MRVEADMQANDPNKQIPAPPTSCAVVLGIAQEEALVKAPKIPLFARRDGQIIAYRSALTYESATKKQPKLLFYAIRCLRDGVCVASLAWTALSIS